MSRLVLMLAISLGSIVLGTAAQKVAIRTGLSIRSRLLAASKLLKIISFFVLNPVAITSSFWKVRLASAHLVSLPLLGLLAVLTGGAGGLLVIRLFRLPPERAASVFVCGMFTNLVTFGGLFSFALFGELGYLLAQLYAMFNMAAYYTLGFPVSRNIARGIRNPLSLSTGALRESPYLAIPLAAIVAGLVLRLTGLDRPDLLDRAVSVIIPLTTALLGVSIGLTLRIGNVRHYTREIALVMSVKFVLVPLVIIPLSCLLGLGRIMGGVPLKVTVVLAFMPVAFNALVPPAIYGFDLDLANSAWIATTASLAVILPLLYLVLV